MPWNTSWTALRPSSLATGWLPTMRKCTHLFPFFCLPPGRRDGGWTQGGSGAPARVHPGILLSVKVHQRASKREPAGQPMCAWTLCSVWKAAAQFLLAYSDLGGSKAVHSALWENPGAVLLVKGSHAEPLVCMQMMPIFSVHRQEVSCLSRGSWGRCSGEAANIWVFGFALRLHRQVKLWRMSKGSCYRCLVRSSVPTANSE